MIGCGVSRVESEQFAVPAHPAFDDLGRDAGNDAVSFRKFPADQGACGDDGFGLQDCAFEQRRTPPDPYPVGDVDIL